MVVAESLRTEVGVGSAGADVVRDVDRSEKSRIRNSRAGGIGRRSSETGGTAQPACLGLNHGLACLLDNGKP